ncbi:MAG: glycerophosphodiester phosphodiesterase family protein [Ignavibacteriaceae bacterium]
MQVNSKYNTAIVAHRGASYAAPENTIAAFQLAFDEKADFIEGDFQLTSDNEIVCIHDPDTKRVTKDKIKMKVRSSTLAELRQLDVGSWKGNEFAGASIPTLQEVLQVIPEGKGIYLEIKDYRELFIKKLAEILKQYSLPANKTRIITFNSKSIDLLKKYLPGIKVLRLFGCGISKKKYFKLLSQRWLIHILKTVQCVGIDAIAAPFMDEKLVQLIRDSKMDFCAFDVENIEDAVKLLNLGVDSITTNSPLKMREEIKIFLK